VGEGDGLKTDEEAAAATTAAAEAAAEKFWLMVGIGTITVKSFSIPYRFLF
jgi:hypothetical protein